MKEIVFRQVQKATCIPAENTEKVGVTRITRGEHDFIFVAQTHIWIRIDLMDNTFSIGDYEG